MEKDKLSSLWQDIAPVQKSKEELNVLLKKYSYPMLSSIKKQLLIESISFTIFLICYFSMFDGATKPLSINLIIIAAIMLQLFYGYKGYLMQGRFRAIKNFRTELAEFINRLKSYRLQTLFARIFFAFSLFLFFIYNISFSQSKWWALFFIVDILCVQLVFFFKVWSARIKKLEMVLNEFTTSVD